jgi:hypothetical protein
MPVWHQLMRHQQMLAWHQPMLGWHQPMPVRHQPMQAWRQQIQLLHPQTRHQLQLNKLTQTETRKCRSLQSLRHFCLDLVRF